MLVDIVHKLVNIAQRHDGRLEVGRVILFAELQCHFKGRGEERALCSAGCDVQCQVARGEARTQEIDVAGFLAAKQYSR